MLNQELTPQEEKELREGQELYEMTRSAGWSVVQTWLEDLAYHSWVDPREAADKKDWEWRELNAFHAANNAKELLERVQKSISQSEYYEKLKSGEIVRKQMGIGRTQ